MPKKPFYNKMPTLVFSRVGKHFVHIAAAFLA